MISKLGTLLCSTFVFLALLGTDARASNIEFGSSGLKIENEDKNQELLIGGRVHLDTLRSKQDLFGDDIAIRRLRLDAYLKHGDHWRFKLDRELAPNRSGWRNVWVEYRKKDIRVKFGQFISPLSTEDLMQSNDLAFVERSVLSALSPSFRQGGSLTYRAKDYTLIGAIMSNPISDSSRRDDGTSYMGRAVYYPVRTSDEVLHLAAAVEKRELSRNSFVDIRSKSEISLVSTSLLKSDRFAEAKDYINLNAEVAYQKGPILLKSQLMRRTTNLLNESHSAEGGYVQASFLLGQARRKYGRSSGTFGAVIPKNKKGVWEVSARVSQLSIDKTGKDRAVSAGLSYYINKNLRLTTTITQSDIETSQNSFSGTSMQSRFQISF